MAHHMETARDMTAPAHTAPRGGMLIAALLLVAGLWYAVLAGPVARLREVQQQRADLAQLVAAPPVSLPERVASDARIRAGDEGAAAKILRDRLTGLARARGLLVEHAAPRPAPWVRTASLSVIVSGDPADIAGFIAAVETGKPVVRFAHWRIVPTGPHGAVQFSGVAVTFWSPAT